MNGYSEHIAVTATRNTYVDEHLHSGFRDILRDVGTGKSIVEVACGSGTLLHALLKEGCRVAGFDLSPGAVEMSKSKGLDVVQGDADRFDSDPVLVDMFRRNPDIIIFSKCLVYLARKSDIFRGFTGKSIYVYQSNPGYWRRRFFARHQISHPVEEFRYRSAGGEVLKVDSLEALRGWGESFGYTSHVVTKWPIRQKNVVVRFDKK